MPDRKTERAAESLLDEVEQLIESVRSRRPRGGREGGSAAGIEVVADRHGRFAGWLTHPPRDSLIDDAEFETV